MVGFKIISDKKLTQILKHKDEKLDEILRNKDEEHVKYVNKIMYEYDRDIKEIYDVDFELKLKINDLQRQLNSLDNNKIRYLRMIETKSFKSKRLNKKYKEKLLREIKLLLGE